VGILESWRAYTTVDALIGKATRKGRAWLLGNLTGIEVPEGEISDSTVISSKPGKQSIAGAFDVAAEEIAE